LTTVRTEFRHASGFIGISLGLGVLALPGCRIRRSAAAAVMLIT
jgi:hypothetical protein